MGPDWKLPKLVGIESIECHVGRQAINLQGSKVWATTPLFQVSKPQQNTLTTHFFAAQVMCLGTINATYYEEQHWHYQIIYYYYLTGI